MIIATELIIIIIIRSVVKGVICDDLISFPPFEKYDVSFVLVIFRLRYVIIS